MDPTTVSPALPLANLTIADRIARAMPTLTRSHRQMADYVLANPFRAATMRIDEFAEAVGASTATANRFARALGMDGYPQFRAELVRGFEATLAPVENLRQELERGSNVAEVFAAVFDENQRNIEATRRGLQPEACERAVAAILQARRIYIIGFGASAWLGGLLQRGLDPYCENVDLLAGVAGASHAARKLFKLRSDDLMIAIAFPRYVSDTVYLAERARDHGVPVLALTDRPTSPLAPTANVSLYACTESNYNANSEATVLSLIEALCVAVALRAQGSLKATAKVAEFVMPWLHGSGTPAERTQFFSTSARSRRDALDTQNS